MDRKQQEVMILGLILFHHAFEYYIGTAGNLNILMI